MKCNINFGDGQSCQKVSVFAFVCPHQNRGLARPQHCLIHRMFRPPPRASVSAGTSNTTMKGCTTEKLEDVLSWLSHSTPIRRYRFSRGQVETAKNFNTGVIAGRKPEKKNTHRLTPKLDGLDDIRNRI